MRITESSNQLTIKSREPNKLPLAVIFIFLGLLMLVNFNFQHITTKNLYGLVFAVPALVLLADVRTTCVVLSKNGSSRFVLKKFRSSEETEFMIGDVQSVRKVEYVGMGNGSTGPNDILRLVVKDKGRLEIGATRNDGILARIFRPYRQQGQKIADFIGVPYEVKKIDLIKEAINNPDQEEPS